MSVQLSGFTEVDKQLAQLPLEIRGKTLKAAMKQAAKVIADRAKQLVPPPGYPGDKPGLRSLLASIKPASRSTQNTTQGLVRAHGQHSHLVEGAYFKDGNWINIDVEHHARGKSSGTILKKTPFIQEAEQQTHGRQRIAITHGVREAVKKATGQ